MPVTPILRVTAGLRGDNVTTENNGGYFGDRSTSNGAFSGFAAATAGPFSGFSVTGQVSRGFRDPTLSDRYFRGPSGRGFITGNPDLEPETRLQFDLTARYTMARTQIGVSYYDYRIDDLDRALLRRRPTSSSSATAAAATSAASRSRATRRSATAIRSTSASASAAASSMTTDRISTTSRPTRSSRLSGRSSGRAPTLRLALRCSRRTSARDRAKSSRLARRSSISRGDIA